MRHVCTPDTDLDELVGRQSDSAGGFRFDYGPIPRAMKNDEELVLENSGELSAFMLAKVKMLIWDLFVVETEERIHAGKYFRLILD